MVLSGGSYGWERVSEEWIAWVMESVKGGKICINVNGERSPYFSTYRGLRQTDPLSLLLFSLVVDVLGVMLDKAKSKGHIKGVIEHLIPRGIIHIQYIDDTVIMVDGSTQSLTNLKLILYYTALSG